MQHTVSHDIRRFHIRRTSRNANKKSKLKQMSNVTDFNSQLSKITSMRTCFPQIRKILAAVPFIEGFFISAEVCKLVIMTNKEKFNDKQVAGVHTDLEKLGISQDELAWVKLPETAYSELSVQGNHAVICLNGIHDKDNHAVTF